MKWDIAEHCATPWKVLCPTPQKPDSPGDQNYNCRRNWKSRFKRIWPLSDNWKWCQTTVIEWLLLCNKAVNPDKCIFFTRLVLVGLGTTVSLSDLTIFRERNASTKNVTVLIKSKSPSPEANPSLHLSAIPKDYQLPKGHFLKICASSKSVLAPAFSPKKIGERWNLKNIDFLKYESLTHYEPLALLWHYFVESTKPGNQSLYLVITDSNAEDAKKQHNFLSCVGRIHSSVPAWLA